MNDSNLKFIYAWKRANFVCTTFWSLTFDIKQALELLK